MLSALRSLKLVALAGLMAAILVIGEISQSVAEGFLVAEENHMTDMVNDHRGAHSLGRLTQHAALQMVARRQAQRMAAAGYIYHNPELQAQSAQAVPDWLRIGENVGVGQDVPSVQQAFLNSPLHHDNIDGRFNVIGLGAVAGTGGRYFFTQGFAETSGAVAPAPAPAAAPSPAPTGNVLGIVGARTGGGYWSVSPNGGVFSGGGAGFFGSAAGTALNRPIVGIASTPSGRGYWLVATDGGIFSFGDARFLGSTGAIALNKPIVGMASTPTGNGYWLVASDGGIFAFGDAGFFGSTGAIALNRPIVGMAPTPSGRGYLLVATDGGIFAFGDGRFSGSTGAIALNRPIAGMASTPTGNGYWLVASDGGIFSFGDAGFFGAGAPAPVVGVASTPTGRGYWLASGGGGVVAFGDARPGSATVQGVTLVRSGKKRGGAAREGAGPVTLPATLRGMLARAAGKLVP